MSARQDFFLMVYLNKLSKWSKLDQTIFQTSHMEIQMNSYNKKPILTLMLLGILLAGWSGLSSALAATQTVYLNAKTGTIMEPDGGMVYMWGYADLSGNFRYPGPTIDVMQGDTVEVHLKNIDVPDPVSVIFFGQEGVSNQNPVYETVGDGSDRYRFEARHCAERRR